MNIKKWKEFAFSMATNWLCTMGKVGTLNSSEACLPHLKIGIRYTGYCGTLTWKGFGTDFGNPNVLMPEM